MLCCGPPAPSGLILTGWPIWCCRDREPFLTVAADIQDGMQAPDITALAQPRTQALALPAGVRVDMGGRWQSP